MTLINRFPSRRVKVDGNVWRFANASSIAWDALSLSPLNFDMVVTGYHLIIVPSGPLPVGRPCLVSLPLLFFSSLPGVLASSVLFVVGVAFTCSRGVSFTGTVRTLSRLRLSAVAQLLERPLRVRKVADSNPCQPCGFIVAACVGLGLTIVT